MESPLILAIDDNLTSRKVIEFHLSQAGYRVASAPDAERGLALARELAPHLILLDHQLPGTTGDEVCRSLLRFPETASVPVIISSAMRNRAFASYANLSNVIDQMPKPYTPEVLKSGVANALKTGAAIVRAQQTGCAMPEENQQHHASSLDGDTSIFPVRSVLDFLNNSQAVGRLSLEVGKARLNFDIASGRFQAATSSTAIPEDVARLLPADLADLAPLLTLTLSERHDPQVSGLIRMLERSLSDPRRLRALLRFQASILVHTALTADPGRFSFEPGTALPPMFQAFPLQASLPSLAIEGVRHHDPEPDPATFESLIFARQVLRGGNLDRAGMSPAEMKAHALLDGSKDIAAIAWAAGLSPAETFHLVRGLELVGQAESRTGRDAASILVLEDDNETARVIQRILGPEGRGYEIKLVRDRVGAQLLLRRSTFDLVLIGLDRSDQEKSYRLCREQSPASTRFVAIVEIQEESELVRLDFLGVDAVLHRPLNVDDLTATVTHLLGGRAMAAAS